MLDALIDQAGMTLFRVIFDKADREATNDNSDPNVMNWSYYNAVYSVSDFQKMWDTATYVRKGKTNTRHIQLQPVAREWMKFHRENTPEDAPLVKLSSLGNRNKEVRKAVFNGKWIQDSLRHGFGTYF